MKSFVFKTWEKPELNLFQSFLRLFFIQLYTTFAWSYDRVAWIVSLGQWKEWTRVVFPYLIHQPVLELGFGPGHMQAELNQEGFDCFGIDVSRQMRRISGRRLRARSLKLKIAQSTAQRLPFPTGAMGSVFATFPAEFIFDPLAIHEIWRVLKQEGTLSVVLMAEHTGKKPMERIFRWIFRITGETWILDSSWLKPYQDAGFAVKFESVELDRAVVTVVKACKATAAAHPPA